MIKKIFLSILLISFISTPFLLNACKKVSLPLVSGHRGVMTIAPENTLASEDSCIRYKIDYMECDVYISKDSVFYLLHDATLDRTTNGSGNIGSWYAADIDTLDAGSWFGEEFKDVRVPRLTEVLRKAKQNNLKLTIDYRTGDLNALLNLIKSEEMFDSCCFTFYLEEQAKQFAAIATDTKSLQVYVREEADVDRLIAKITPKPGIAVIRFANLTPELIKKCREHEMKILVLILGTEDKAKDYEKAIALGVDIVATDHPKEFKMNYVDKLK